MNDGETERLSWIIKGGPECHHTDPRKATGLTRREEKVTRRESAGLGEWSGVAASQRMPAATGAGRGKRRQILPDSPPRAPGSADSCISSRWPRSRFRPPEPERASFGCLKAPCFCNLLQKMNPGQRHTSHPHSRVTVHILNPRDTYSSAQTSQELRPGSARKFSDPFLIRNPRTTPGNGWISLDARETPLIQVSVP